MKCEANGCQASVYKEHIRGPDGSLSGVTLWRFLPGWAITYVRFEAKDDKPAHERIVVLCPMHGAGLTPKEQKTLPVWLFEP